MMLLFRQRRSAERRLMQAFRLARQRRRQHILNALGERETHLRTHIIRQFAQIHLIIARQNDMMNASAARGEYLFLDAADRQD